MPTQRRSCRCSSSCRPARCRSRCWPARCSERCPTSCAARTTRSALAVPGDCCTPSGRRPCSRWPGRPPPTGPARSPSARRTAAQFALDFALTTGREWAAFGVKPRLQPQLFGWVVLVDLLLTPIGLLAAVATTGENDAVRPRRPAHRAARTCSPASAAPASTHALELGRAYRGTTLLLGEVLEAEDEYTGGAQPRGGVDRWRVAREMGLDAGRRNVEFAALLHDIGKIAIPNEIMTKPAALNDEEWEEITHPHDRGPADARARRRPARRHRADRAFLPRALGRPRLPRRPGRRGDPARGAHRVSAATAWTR